MVAQSREFLQRRAISPTRATTRAQQSFIKRQIQLQATQQIQKFVPKVETKQVNYEAAWKEANKHWSKGKAGAYLYWMKREAGVDPQIGAIYSYIKELDKQTRAGNISPGRSTGSLLAREQIKIQQTPKIDFSKIETGKITYAPEFNTYYTRDDKGKLIVTSGIRGFDYLTETIKTGGQFKSPSFKPLPDRKIPGAVTVPSKVELAASRVKIVPSSIPNKVIVTLPSGVKGTISSTGMVVIGKKLGGHRYVFQDGKIISIDGQSTLARKEFVIPEPTITKIEQPTGIIARNIKKLNDLRKVKSTSSIRNKQRELKNELKLLGVTVATTVIGGVIAIIALPSTLYKLAKNPSKLLAIPTAIKSGLRGFVQTIRISPTEALGMIAGEIYFLRGMGKVTKIIGKVSKPVTIRLNPYFKKVDKGIINIKTTKGETTLEVGVIGKGVPLKKQVRLSGKKLEVAVSVQADSIINLLSSRQKFIRKPIPGEEALLVKTRLLLKKFDEDKISRKEFFELNKRLIRETGDKTLLERSLFLDPKGKVRFTRLAGEQPEAGIMDILTGDFTFKTPTPQVLVFTDVSVAKFPAGLRDVARKLKAGKTLTELERIRLVEWQLKKSGKLKPVGDVRYRGGIELEVTIAPGELIKRVKKLGVTLINGKKVDIIEVRIFKPNPILKSKVLKADKGLLNKKQLKILEKELERVTGFKSSAVRRTPVGRRRARLPVRGLRIGSKAARSRLDRIEERPTGRPPRKVTKGPPRGVPRPPRKVTKRPLRGPPKRVTGRPPAKPPKRPPIIPIKLLKQFTKKKLSKSQPVFYIKVKKRGRMVNLTPRPLILRDAKDYLAYSVDNSLVRTAYFEPLGRTRSVIRIPPKMRGYFSKNKRKLRPYKIKVGVRKQLRLGYIERKKYIGDTKLEVRQLQAARIKTKKKTIKRKPVKRVITRKKLPTLNQLNSRKKALISKRKKMLNKLKKK